MNKIFKLFIISFLLLSSLSYGEEKVILITNGNISIVEKMLTEGWKIKHQSVAATSSAATANGVGRIEPLFKEKLILLFTLEKL